MIFSMLTLFLTIAIREINASTSQQSILPYGKFYFCEHLHKSTTEHRLPDPKKELEWQNDCQNDCSLINAYFVGQPEKHVRLICFNRFINPHMNQYRRDACECVYSRNPSFKGGRNPGYQSCNPPKILRNTPINYCGAFCYRLQFQVYHTGDNVSLLAFCEQLPDLKFATPTGISKWDKIPTEKKRTCHCGLQYDPNYLNRMDLPFPAVPQATDNPIRAGLIPPERGNNTERIPSYGRLQINPVTSSTQIGQSLEKRQIYTHYANSTQHSSRIHGIESSSMMPVLGQPSSSTQHLPGASQGPSYSSRNIQWQPHMSQRSSSSGNIQSPTHGYQRSSSSRNIQSLSHISQGSSSSSRNIQLQPHVSRRSSSPGNIPPLSHASRRSSSPRNIQSLTHVPQRSSSPRNIQSVSQHSSKQNLLFPINTEIAHGLSCQTEKISLEPRQDNVDLHLRLGSKAESSRGLMITSSSVPKVTSTQSPAVTIFGQSLSTNYVPHDSRKSPSLRNHPPAPEQSLKPNHPTFVNTQIMQGVPHQAGKISRASSCDSLDLDLRIGSKLASSRGSGNITSASGPKSSRSRSPSVTTDMTIGTKKFKNFKDLS